MLVSLSVDVSTGRRGGGAGNQVAGGAEVVGGRGSGKGFCGEGDCGGKGRGVRIAVGVGRWGFDSGSVRQSGGCRRRMAVRSRGRSMAWWVDLVVSVGWMW